MVTFFSRASDSFNPSSIYIFAKGQAFRGGGVLTPPPEISRTTRPIDLKFGPVIHLNKKAQIPPVLIRPPVCCVFYRPESKLAFFRDCS